jgi:transposase InsO family protein
MQSISLIEHAWELSRADLKPDDIAHRLDKHRATIYRWLDGIRAYGIREFLCRYERAKKGRRQKRKTDPVIKARIYAIRERYHHCCGEKIRYWLKREHGMTVGLSTIYRVLGEKYVLRSKWKKNQIRGLVPKARKQREVIQHDTVDFGGLYAFTSVDIFSREAQVVMRRGREASDGLMALRQQMAYFKFAEMLQRDGGSEFKAEWNEVAKVYCHRIRTARPYKKNEQSYIESFNRTLRKECLGWAKYKKTDLETVQARVDEFVDFYNTRRPHLSLNLLSPAEYLSHLR